VRCKFGGEGRPRNVVELAEVGDIVIGTGGQGPCSTGNGTLVYAMQLTQKLSFNEYVRHPKLSKRIDAAGEREGNLFALVSKRFVYFGRDAIRVASLPRRFRNIAKKGPGFKRLVPGELGVELLDLLIRKYGKGRIGMPVRPVGTKKRGC
jgi:hypothetical protein